MNRSNLELKVGIITICGIIVLVVGSIWGRDVKISSNYRQLDIVFDHSGGIRPGDAVNVNGIKKGRVETVELLPHAVKVSIVLSTDVILYKDMKAQIVMLDLMGGTVLEVTPGRSDQPMDFASLPGPIRGQSVASLALLVAEFQAMRMQADTLLSQMTMAVGNLNYMLDKRTFVEPLKASVANLQISTNMMKQILSKNEKSINELIANAGTASDKMQKLIDNKGDALGKSIDSFVRASGKIDTITTDLQEISRQLHQRKGSLAKLIYEDDVYNDLQKTIAGLDSLSRDLQSNMGKYLQGTDVNLLNLLKF
ncbi:MAG: MCE family protein [Calditrichaeota bacterium]|nr:MAG: MCE family protein [Calditrichota bacterium]